VTVVHLPGAGAIFDELFRESVATSAPEAAELAALAVLGGGPDHIAVFEDHPNGSDGLVSRLRAVCGLAVPEVEPSIQRPDLASKITSQQRTPVLLNQKNHYLLLFAIVCKSWWEGRKSFHRVWDMVAGIGGIDSTHQ
jgi:hypothetical protein